MYMFVEIHHVSWNGTAFNMGKTSVLACQVPRVVLLAIVLKMVPVSETFSSTKHSSPLTSRTVAFLETLGYIYWWIKMSQTLGSVSYKWGPY